jgi:hypothetical protein
MKGISFEQLKITVIFSFVRNVSSKAARIPPNQRRPGIISLAAELSGPMSGI